MSRFDRRDPPPFDPESWDYDAARRVAVSEGLRMTPAERLRWLEETMEDLETLVGAARGDLAERRTASSGRTADRGR